MRETYFRLEVAAELSGLTTSRVRRFQRAGLVAPARVVGRQALYGEREIARLRRLRRLSDHLSLNLAALSIVVRLVDELQDLRSRLDSEST